MSTIHPSVIPSLALDGPSRAVRTKDSAAVIPGSVSEILEARGEGKAGSATTAYDGYLKIFRGNPEALLEIFQKGREIFNQQSVNTLLPDTAKNVMVKVTKIIDSLLCSPKRRSVMRNRSSTVRHARSSSSIGM